MVRGTFCKQLNVLTVKEVLQHVRFVDKQLKPSSASTAQNCGLNSKLWFKLKIQNVKLNETCVWE